MDEPRRPPVIIDHALFDRVTAAARESPRGRKNFNFHPAETDPCNRMLNAIEPGSYISPHQHADPFKDEAVVCVRGRIGVVFFEADGRIARTVAIAPGGPVVGVDLPPGTWHTFVALEPGTVIFETKAGPYVPISEAERAPWAPREGAPEAAAYLRSLAELFRPERRA